MAGTEPRAPFNTNLTLAAGSWRHCAYSVIGPDKTMVELEPNAVPEPSATVFHPVNTYPGRLIVDGDGSENVAPLKADTGPTVPTPPLTLNVTSNEGIAVHWANNVVDDVGVNEAPPNPMRFPPWAALNHPSKV